MNSLYSRIRTRTIYSLKKFHNYIFTTTYEERRSWLDLQSWTSSTTAKAPFLSPPLTASKCRMGYRLTGLKVAKVCDNWAHFEKLSVTSLEKKTISMRWPILAHRQPPWRWPRRAPTPPPSPPPGRPSAPPARTGRPAAAAPPRRAALDPGRGKRATLSSCAHKG